MKIKKIEIPQDILINYYLPSDYSDAFECTFTTLKEISPDEVQIAFWTTMPPVVKWLFKLRNILVKPFKLESGTKIEELKECIQNGKSTPFVSIVEKTKDETILQMRDKHLNFYLSVKISNKENNNKSIIATTVVNFNNKLGKCYFFIISPFHDILVRMTLKYIVRKHWT